MRSLRQHLAELAHLGLFLAAGALILTVCIAAASGDGSLFVEVQ